MARLPTVETAATVGGLCDLLDGADPTAEVRGAVVIYEHGQVTRIIGLAPGLDDPPVDEHGDPVRD